MASYKVLGYPDGARGTRVSTFEAKGTIDFGTLVYRSAADGVIETSADTDLCIGVALADEATEATNSAATYVSGDQVVVALRGGGEVFNLLAASAGFTQGDLIAAAAGGAVATHSVGTNDYKIVGQALETKTSGNRGLCVLF